MATDSVATQIKDMLENNWSLVGRLLASEMHFEAGWYNADWSNNPQVTVTRLLSGDLEYFGRTIGHADMHYISRDIYAVSIWLSVPSGSDGSEEETDLDLIINEIIRILVNQTSSFAPPLGRVLPVNRGRTLSVFNQTPRLVRWEIPVWANYIS